MIRVLQNCARGIIRTFFGSDLSSIPRGWKLSFGTKKEFECIRRAPLRKEFFSEPVTHALHTFVLWPPPQSHFFCHDFHLARVCLLLATRRPRRLKQFISAM
jgi:hypothetical protein